MPEPPEPRPDGVDALIGHDDRDRRKGPRRGPRDRRAGTAPPPGVERRATDRRQSDRRSPTVPTQYRGNVRSINEYPLQPDELEFINAINAYKERHSRPFPTWSEVLHVLKFLGYRKGSGGPGGAAGDQGARGGDAG